MLGWEGGDVRVRARVCVLRSDDMRIGDDGGDEISSRKGSPGGEVAI